MHDRRNRLALAIVLAMAASIVLAGASGSDPGIPASAEQEQAFTSLIQRYRWVFFDGWVSGDLSQFPSVFCNDLAYPPNAFFRSLIADHRDEIDADLDATNSGPVGAPTGELAAQMADVITRRESQAQWSAAVATATAEGRAPTLQDMPDGQPPAYTPSGNEWMEKTIFTKEATIHGSNHATVVYVYDSPSSHLYFHLHLTKVAGAWYISDSWTTGNP
jgi:hypothetical protein